MLIAEDLLLLLLDDDSGASRTQWMKQALGGALLVELALDGAVAVGEKRWWRAGRVTTVAGVPAPSDPLLADALATIAARRRTAQDLVERLGRHQQERLAERLVAAGILEHRSSRVLGLFPRERWPVRDLMHEEQVRRALATALVEGREPDQRTAALIALLHAVDRAHRSIDRGDVPAREIKRRAKRIAEGDWAAKAVKDAIQAATAAMTAATTAATTAAITSG